MWGIMEDLCAVDVSDPPLPKEAAADEPKANRFCRGFG